MPITPWNAGQTRPVWDVTWKNVDLSGATLSVRFAPQPGQAGNASAGSGTFRTKIATSGRFTYAPSATDLTAPGAWLVQFKATYGDGTFMLSDPMPITVQAAV